MAPPPEYDKEPKAPDKSATNISTEDSKLIHNLVNDQHTNSDHKPTNTVAAVEVENNKHVETLDDGQLRALLDEAITYKCPKDREGKSSLFKELLEEVEQDEQACEAAARTLSGARGARRAARGRRALPHSNSLQDLVAALAAEPAPRRPHARAHAPAPPHTNVSARALHGGSLPSGVDTSSLLSEEPARGAGYLATVRCVNPPPLAERRVSASDANTPAEMELLNRRSKPMFPMTYTARATLEIGSGSVCSGRAVTTTTASNQVDSAISFSCITTPEVVASCNTTSSSAQSAVAVDPKPRSMISSSFNGLPLSRPNYGSTGSSATDDYKKSLDENGNSVQGFSSPLSGSSQHKKPRRKKSSKNETVIDCQQIDGYQGDKDVNELLRFIESNADNGRAPKLGRVKHKDDSDEKGGKKRSTERRKDKENKIKRASSLEELSRTKIEDLTDVAESPLRGDKKDRRSDNTAAKAERRSWGDDALAYTAVAADCAAAAELTDFQTVTKKRKPRRRADDPAPRRARPPSPRARRESAPPSERSNDSNDDMDSVHSLPAAPPPPAPAAPPPAPHASYADIARTRHNIPDLIESCNFYAEGAAAAAGDAAGDAAGEAAGEPGGDAAGDADGYPALEARSAARRRDAKPAAPLRRERKERAPPPAEAPDVVADRRPPVILLDSAARPRDMDGVTFGFDINEQLLSAGARRPRCDLLRDAPEPGVRVRAGCAALRYVAPEPPPDAAALLQLVDYVGAAWEDVVRCGGGKVRYFSE